MTQLQISERFGSLLTSWSSKESRLNDKGGHLEDEDDLMDNKGNSTGFLKEVSDNEEQTNLKEIEKWDAMLLQSTERKN